MTDIIVIAILAVAVGAALNYIIRAKKRGVKCIGCPSADSCSSCSPASCGCDGGSTRCCK